jgi:hypothetical protein
MADMSRMQQVEDPVRMYDSVAFGPELRDTLAEFRHFVDLALGPLAKVVGVRRGVRQRGIRHGTRCRRHADSPSMRRMSNPDCRPEALSAFAFIVELGRNNLTCVSGFSNFVFIDSRRSPPTNALHRLSATSGRK